MTPPTGLDLMLTLQSPPAGFLASVVGWQRHHRGRPARVAMAAVCFTVAGVYGFGPTRPPDVTRIAAQVVTGVGFLGAGTIFRAEDHVYGLTTAATLWFAAAVGVLVGAGLTWTAVSA